MALTHTGPIKNGVVRLIRSSSDLRAALKGGIHQSVAPSRVKYPFVVYSRVSAPYLHDWGGGDHSGTREIHALVDIGVFSLNPVEAENLDALIDRLFSSVTADVTLDELVAGQKVILCRRVADMPTGPDRDDEGRRIAHSGGTYEIWTTQPIP